MEAIKVSQIGTRLVNETVKVMVVVKELKEIDTTGRNYSQTMVVLEDRTGATTFPIWKTKDSVEMDLIEGQMYSLVANISLHDGVNQLKYISSKILEDNATNRKNIDPNFSRSITPENEQVLLSTIEKGFSEERYRRYAEVALGLGEVPSNVDEKEYRQRLEVFKRAWASVNSNDNYPGGLWNHTVGLLRLVHSIRAQYESPIGRQETKSEINWDHLLLMCILHDIEVPNDHVVENNKCYRDIDTKSNHIINGVGRVSVINSEVEKRNRLTHSEFEDIKYGILCHHAAYNKDTEHGYVLYGDFEVKSSEDKIFSAINLIDTANVEALRLE